MWTDNNDEILKLYTQLDSGKKFPTKCPVCNNRSAHLYMHVENLKTRRGGFWVWCSECHVFSHGSIYVQDNWINYSGVNEEKLTATPGYLEKMKEEIDAHVNESLM